MAGRTQWFVIFALTAATSGWAWECNSLQRQSSASHSLTGIVHTVGNDPFVRLVVMLDADSLCYLHGDSAVLGMLFRHQGEKVKIWYEQSIPSPEGTILTIVKAELVDSD